MFGKVSLFIHYFIPVNHHINVVEGTQSAVRLHMDTTNTRTLAFQLCSFFGFIFSRDRWFPEGGDKDKPTDLDHYC